MHAHPRFSRIAALLVLLVLAASGLRLPPATPRVQAMQPQHTPAAAISTSAWIPQGPAPALAGQEDLVNILPANEPVSGSLGGAPYSGGHNQIVASPTDPNTIYVGADGGIWKTTNALAASPTWTSLIDDKPSLVINGLSADPTDATFQTILAGTDRAGLYYTTNGGASWTQISNATIVPSGYSGGYRAVAARGNTLLVTAATTSSPSVSGLFRTTGGPSGTWTKISGTGGLPNAPADGLVGDPANPNRLYVMVRGASGGIFRSDDTGATWTNVSAGINIISSATSYFDGIVFNNGTINVVTVTLNGTAPTTVPVASATQAGTTATITTAVAHGFSAGQSVTVADISVAGYNGTFTIASVPSSTTLTYTTAASGLASATGGTATSNTTVKRLFRSVNGAAFTALDTPSGSASFMSADKTNPNLVYVGGYEYSAFRVDASQPSGSQVTRLTDQGATTLSAAATSTATTISVAATTGMPTTLPFVVTIDSEQLSVTAISGKNLTVVRGVNGTTPAAHSSGATVLGYNYGVPHPDYTSFTFDATGRLLAGSHGGLYRLPQPSSPPSATNYWVPIMSTIGAFQFDSIAYDNLSNLLAGGSQDNGAPTQTTGGIWSLVAGGDGGDTLVDNVTLAGSAQSVRYQSAQNLAQFGRRVYDAAGSQVGNPTWINTAVITDKRFFTPLAQNAVASTRFLIAASGHLYETLDQFATITSIANVAVGGRAMAYGGYQNGVANPDVLYFSNASAIYRRTTAGGAVTQVAALPSGVGVITYLAMDTSDWMRVFVVDDKGQVYQTTDGGSTWSNITGNLKTGAGSFGPARTITMVPGAAGYLAVGTDNGVYASLLSSLGTWSRLGTGLPLSRVSEIVYDATDDVLVIGTYARGAYTLPNASQEFVTALSGPTVADGTQAALVPRIVTPAAQSPQAPLGHPIVTTAANSTLASPCFGPATGQVSCWPAEGDATDAWDSNHGTPQNGTTFATGLVGQAFSFDGVDDYVLVPDANNLDLTTDLTIGAWIYQTAQQSGYHVVVGKGRSPTGTGYAMGITDGHAGIGLIKAGNAVCTGEDSQTLPLGQWNHLAVTFSSSTAKVYVNGQLRDTQTCGFTGVDASTEPLNIGRETSGLAGRNFAGLADEVQVYNRALSLAEIQAIYNAELNTAPVAVDDSYSTDQDTPLTVAAPGVLSNDTDADSDSLTAVNASDPANGTVTLNADGSFIYTPDAGFFGSDSFTYQATDGYADSNVATVTITVTHTPPTASVTGPSSALAGQQLTFVFSATDTNPDHQAAGFTYSIDWGDGATTTVDPVIGTGDAIARHAYAATGSYSVQVTATDQDGATSAPASTAITIDALTTASLQSLIATTPMVYLVPTSDAILHSEIAAINGLSDPGAPVDITILLGTGPYTGVTLSPAANIVLALAGSDTIDTTGTQITGASPAVTSTRGNVVVQGVVLTTATDSPTVLVTGGNLSLAQSWIDESTGFNNAAIKLTGGHLDYGVDLVTNINGDGGFFQVPDRRAIGFPEGIDDFLVPNMFAKDGVALPTSHRSATSLVRTPATASTFGQPVTFTAYVDTNVADLGSATGTVTFYDGATLLATVPLQTSGGLTTATYTTSSLSTGAHTIQAFYSGDNLFVASSATLTHQVSAYPFAGFFTPVANPPTFNQVNAGQNVPFKFSLGGNRGLSIIAAGYPVSQPINCSTAAPIGAAQPTTAGTPLSYDTASGQYTYTWKTESTWKGTCRQFTLRLADGTDHLARFRFK